MKYISRIVTHIAVRVTPHVGVWIEILKVTVFAVLFVVTPHVGVWIEIDIILSFRSFVLVTPHVGVWIEICQHLCTVAKQERHSPRGSVD